MITWPIFVGLFMALTLMYFSNKKENDAEEREIYEIKKKEEYDKKIKDIAERNRLEELKEKSEENG